MTQLVLTGPGVGPMTAEVTIDLAAGCRLARVRLIATDVPAAGDGVDLLAVADDRDPTSIEWGCYPMAPWAGRLRHGRFEHDGRQVELARNHRDGGRSGGGPIRPPMPPATEAVPDASAHAIHGIVFGRPWTLEAHTKRSLTASCSLTDDDPMALGWPFAGTARQTIEVGDDHLRSELSVEANPGSSFPAVIGWHPWFAKPARLEFEPSAMLERDDHGLPTGRLVDVPPPPWDDCFRARGPIRMHHDRTLAPVVTIDADCDHWVVFDAPPHATCVEPQSGPPDAPNITARVGSEAAVEVVSAGRPLRRTMTIAW
ncbi:MAG: aldose epimerase [Actinomycetota bacterium]